MMKLYPIGWFVSPSRSFELFSGQPRGYDDFQEESMPPDFDEMVHVDGKNVVWSAGNGGAVRVYKSYRQVLTAKQALLCSFVGVGNGEQAKTLGVTGDSHVGDQQAPQSNFGASPTGGTPMGAVDVDLGKQQQQENAELDQDDRCLCVLQGLECVKIYAPDGAEFEVALPCKAARMWALPRGLLIERAVPRDVEEEEDGENNNNADNSNRNDNSFSSQNKLNQSNLEDTLSPMFFSLLHPLEELKPVSYTIQPSQADMLETNVTKFGTIDEDIQMLQTSMDEGLVGTKKLAMPERLRSDDADTSSEMDQEVVGEFMCDTRERILFVDNELCLVVTYHEENRTHSVWLLLPATAVNASTLQGRQSPKKNFNPRANQEADDSPFIIRSSPQGNEGKLDDMEGLSSTSGSTTSGEYDDDDDDDDVIESEVYMQCVWTGASDSNPADCVFTCHSCEGVPLICLMHYTTNTLQALSVKSETRGGSHSSFNSPLATTGSSILATPLPSLVRAAPRDRILVESAFEMRVKAAQPVVGTGPSPILDMIVLTLDGELELYRGNMKLCKLDIALDKVPPLPSSANVSKNGTKRRYGRNFKPEELGKIVRLEHAVSNRVNVVYENGCALRVTIAMGFQSKLIRPCLQGIDNALPADLSLQLRVDVAICYDMICHNKDPAVQKLVSLLVGEQGLAKTGTSVDLEWAALVLVIALLLKKNSITIPSSPGNTSTQLAGLENLFERMLQTDYHKAYETSNRHILSFLESKRPQSSDGDDEDHQNDAWHSVLHQLEQKSSVLLISKPSVFARNLGVLILGLHLVYEEFKLSTLTWPLIRPIGALLRGLVEASLESGSCANYLDHYARDLGVVETIRFPPIDSPKRIRISVQSPPDIFDWLTKRMKKASGNYRMDSTIPQSNSQPPRSVLDSVMLRGGTAADNNNNNNRFGAELLSMASAQMRPFPELESCFRTQQLCCFFELLSGGSGEEATVVPLEFRLNRENRNQRATSKSPVVSAIVSMDSSFSYWMEVHGYEARNAAERTVLGMVWYGFTLQQLETLTLGLSIPLREVLHFCRSNPSSRWPADAYVLVGREDMAALALAPTPPSIPAYLLFDDGGESAQEKQDDKKAYLTPVSSHHHHKNNTRGSVPSSARQKRRASAERTPPSITTPITTAVTPVWRRLPNGGQGVAAQVADDILWGGQAAQGTGHGGQGASTFLEQHQKHHGKGGGAGGTSKLLSIADFSKLSASASAEVGGSNDDILGQDATGPGQAGSTSGGQAQDTSTEKQGLLDPSGFNLLQRMTTLRFGNDRRIREVCRLLRSSGAVRLVVDRGPETSDHELVAAQQAKLLLISRRTMGLPVGRGMITLGTVRPLLTDTVDIPPISLAGKIPPNNAIVKLDLAAIPHGGDLLSWPRFHNGAAAGLRLAAGRQVTPLTRTWIAYNRPETPNHTHAGFLLALGLHGHLAALTMADIYEYLAQGHDATTVAIMLGLSAAKRGTMAPTISKMLCLHIPSLLPAAFSDMDFPSVVQTAAIMGVGLLYQGTAHRLMTEFLLAEIGRRPTSDRCMDRESYSLAAGLSLGLVTLGHGAKPGGLSGLADLRLEDRLHRYMVGGLDPDVSNGTNNASDPTKCSRVREGPYVNVNVTSPGATLALAFIFLKSGNESVATRLAIPDTHFLLDYVRPDLLALRVLARNLVLWDSVEPTEEWLLGQIPPAIRFSFYRLAGGGTTAAAVLAANTIHMKHAHTTDEDEVIDDQQMVDVDHDDDPNIEDSEDDEEDDDEPTPAPPPLPPSTQEEGVAATASSTSFSTPSNPPRRRRAHSQDAIPSRPIARLKRRGNSMASMRSKVTSIGEDSDGKPRRNTGVPVDEQAVRQAHANIIAGACFSIGLRFVGTASKSAQQVLIKYLRHFIGLRTCEPDSPQASQRPDKSTLEMCLGTAAISLALVMAGTGDLDTLRLLRSLRFKTDEAVTYGNHMAIGSAIGILFLGGGRVSFRNDNASIAALVISFFPRFPLHTMDNQYHLQALRHLYVLATEQRCVDAYDIDSRSPCYLPLEVTIRENAMKYYADRVSNTAGGSAKKSSKQTNANTAGTGSTENESMSKTRPKHETSGETVIKIVAPCLLPPLSWISSIRVASPRYWPVEINLDGEKNLAQKLAICAYRVICVKRKVGHLSYVEDPQGVSSLLARPRLKLKQTQQTQLSSDYMRAFTADPHVLAFAKYFCSVDENGPLFQDDREFVDFCTATLYDCLTHEKPEMLNELVNLYQTARVFRDANHSLHVRNVKLLNSFYSHEELEENIKMEHAEQQSLIGRDFLQSLNSSFQNEIEPFDERPELLRHYLLDGKWPTGEMLQSAWKASGRKPMSSNNLRTLFATYLDYYSIPEQHVLHGLNLAQLNLKTVPGFTLQNIGTVEPSAILKMAFALK